MRHLVGLLFYLLGSFSFAANEKSTNSVPTYKISVDAKLLSHFIERGLSISDKNPAMNASFLFNLGPQFRFGFWGSNIANISAQDDNFWFKFLAEVKVDFNATSGLKVYLTDDHYYKSSVRNGQIAGIKLNYNMYYGVIEWMNNYQGSHTDSIYLGGGRLFNSWRGTKIGGEVGYTQQHATGLENYFDFKILGMYQVTPNFQTEAGVTAITNESQFNGRGEPAFYLSISLNY
jgi:hypothetical protein